MSNGLHFSEEPMTDNELFFLQAKERKDKALFVRSFRFIGLLSVLTPSVLAVITQWVLYLNPKPKLGEVRLTVAQIYLYYGIGMCFLVILVALSGYLLYRRWVMPIGKDVRRGLKTIEKSRIVRKQHIGNNDSYHFYLQSAYKLSIEVAKEDFEAYSEGDEINIEYSTYSRNFFGYF
ncbi:MAG: hypothetical protein QM642_01745 [Edaphocola sp.]